MMQWRMQHCQNRHVETICSGNGNIPLGALEKLELFYVHLEFLSINFRIGQVMDVFKPAPGSSLLGVTFARRVQTPTDASNAHR
jgi:hypothetical protein